MDANLPILSRFERRPFSPAFGLCPPRPFASRSLAFSAAFPRQRCSGLTHEGLSQVCITNAPFGSGPLAHSQAATCAPISRYCQRTLPYPSLSLCPSHQWQSEPLCIEDSALRRQRSEQYTFRFELVLKMRPQKKHCCECGLFLFMALPSHSIAFNATKICGV